jgi:hypothetical protein
MTEEAAELCQLRDAINNLRGAKKASAAGRYATLYDLHTQLTMTNAAQRRALDEISEYIPQLTSEQAEHLAYLVNILYVEKKKAADLHDRYAKRKIALLTSVIGGHALRE